MADVCEQGHEASTGGDSQSMNNGCIVVFGEACVDIIVSSLASIPEFGKSVYTRDPIVAESGGGALNTALSLAELNKQGGPEVVFAGPISADAWGEFLIKKCETYRVKLAMIPMKEVPSSVCVLLGGQGVKAIVESESGACGSWRGDGIDWKDLAGRGMKVLHFGALSLLYKMTSRELIDIIKTARELSPGVIVTVDTNSLTQARFTELMEPALGEIDALLPNKQELSLMGSSLLGGLGVDTSPDKAAEFLLGKLRKSQSRMVAWSDSSKGASICASHPDGTVFHFKCKGVQGVKVRDPTGAGNAFNAGLLHALLQGQCPQDALKYGCAAGAVTCTRQGGANPPVNKDEVLPLVEMLAVETNKAE